MAPTLAAPAANNFIHHYRRGDDPYKGGPNLKVLIPVIIILGIVGFFFFGWLGLPWPKIKAWWRRKRRGRNDEPPEVNLPKDDDVDEAQSTTTPRRSSAREVEAQPGSQNSYGTLFELGQVDALRLNRIKAQEGQDYMAKTKIKSKGGDKTNTETPVDPATRTFRGETREQRQQRLQEQELRVPEPPPAARLAPSEPSSGQATPSAPPERRASPWDPTSETT